MTVKYMHIRMVGPDGEIYPCGGVTLAYSIAGKDIVVAWTKCRNDELFCFAKGRAQAIKKLQAVDADIEVLPVSHPISHVLADYIATVVWPGTLPEDLGYRGEDMGFPIDVYQDDRNRWLSSFEPALGHVNFETNHIHNFSDNFIDEEGLTAHQAGFGHF